MTVLLVSDLAALPSDGWLFDDAAVFGVRSHYSPLAVAPGLWSVDYIAERVAARSALYAEEEWGLDDECWWGVAAVATGCDELAQMSPSARAVAVCALTFAAAWSLARRLPHPPRALRNATWTTANRHAEYGLLVAEAGNAAAPLARALADDDWTDPCALAGWLQETISVLVLCRRALRELVDRASVASAGLTPRDPRRRRGAVRTTPSRGGCGARAGATLAALPCPRARAPVISLSDRPPQPPGPNVA